MVALRLWWAHEHGSDGVLVRTPSELDAALEKVRTLAPDWPAIVELLIDSDPGHAILDVGIDGDRGVLYYAGESCTDGEYSKGEQTADAEPLLYYYMDSDTEYPADAEIPLAIARQAAHEYMATGGRRPTCVAWQPWR
jgi:hypothetical protein